MTISLEKVNSNFCLRIRDNLEVFDIIGTNNGIELSKNGQSIDLQNLVYENQNLFNKVKDYFIDNVVKNYIEDKNVTNLLNSLKITLSFLKQNKTFNYNEAISFLEKIFTAYKNILNEKEDNVYSTDAKFFVSNIVQEFMEDIKEKYNNSNTLDFVKFILSFIDDISFQSKIIDGLINYKSNNSDKDFVTDIIENFDFTELSIKDVAKLYAIISRQNANKNAIKIIDKINNEYISKLNDSDLNYFSDYFLKNVNNINYFNEKSNINIANYSQTVINYFDYVSKSRNYNCFNNLVNSINKNIINVDFGSFKLVDILEKSLIEQSIKSIKNRNQKRNFTIFFKKRNKKYLNEMVSCVTDSVFIDGISSKKSGRFLMVDNKSIFEKALTKKIRCNKFSNEKKHQVLLRNKNNLYKLSRVKSFKKEFLNNKIIISFLKNKNMKEIEKSFLLNFYINKILFNKKCLSKNRIISYFQKKIKTSSVQKFKRIMEKEGIQETDFAIKGTNDKIAPKSCINIKQNQTSKSFPNTNLNSKTSMYR